MNDDKPTSDIVVVEKNCDYTGGVSNTDKWIIAAIIGIIFILLASPFLFNLTNYVCRPLGVPTRNPQGKPTVAGLVIHGIIFVLIVRLLMH